MAGCSASKTATAPQEAGDAAADALLPVPEEVGAVQDCVASVAEHAALVEHEEPEAAVAAVAVDAAALPEAETKAVEEDTHDHEVLAAAFAATAADGMPASETSPLAATAAVAAAETADAAATVPETLSSRITSATKAVMAATTAALTRAAIVETEETSVPPTMPVKLEKSALPEGTESALAFAVEAASSGLGVASPSEAGAIARTIVETVSSGVEGDTQVGVVKVEGEEEVPLGRRDPFSRLCMCSY
eukprot:TRINITY_DN14716_c1_g1_i1.p1 TRINITY_DN14716_c1_g1~~TRINITY_DN14716_c1_g1_i1.p1  ORF type:complete len:276 (+),score=73.24 TRINITY_DN14716_c1_g1_i1:85-828(+)